MTAVKKLAPAPINTNALQIVCATFDRVRMKVESHPIKIGEFVFGGWKDVVRQMPFDLLRDARKVHGELLAQHGPEFIVHDSWGDAHTLAEWDGLLQPLEAEAARWQAALDDTSK